MALPPLTVQKGTRASPVCNAEATLSVVERPEIPRMVGTPEGSRLLMSPIRVSGSMEVPRGTWTTNVSLESLFSWSVVFIQKKENLYGDPLRVPWLRVRIGLGLGMRLVVGSVLEVGQEWWSESEPESRFSVGLWSGLGSEIGSRSGLGLGRGLRIGVKSMSKGQG